MVQGSKILMIDDDADSLRFVRAILEKEHFEVSTCTDGGSALRVLDGFQPDLVLLDVHMPGLNGFETIERIREDYENIAVIFLTGDKDTEVLIRGLESGALDYIHKPFVPQELTARIKTQLRVKKLQDQLLEANRKLQNLVDVDDLTGLLNMRTVYEKVDHEIQRARRYGHGIGLIMLDMDGFKAVNDDHDHLFGSHVLATVGKIIKKNIRSVDFAARYGGDEFLICLTHTDPKGAEAFAERLRAVIEETEFTHEADAIRLTASMGLAVVLEGDPQMDARSVVRQADRALYTSKENGRNQVTTRLFADEGSKNRHLMRS